MRFLAALLVCLGALAFVPDASARPAATKGGCAFDGVLESEHFAVHWTGDAACGDELYTQPQAGQTLAQAEAAYAMLVGELGYPGPVDDGDGKVDIYVYDLDPYAALWGWDDGVAGGTSSAWWALNPSDGANAELNGFGVFHAVTFAMWDVWQEAVAYGAGHWAGLRAAGWPAAGTTMLELPELALDCYGEPCDPDLYVYKGSARWPFYAYLEDRWGAGIVKELWQRIASNGALTAGGFDALGQVLAGKGTSLTDVFNDFAGAVAAGAITPLKGVAPAYAAELATGTVEGASASARVTANHLAVRFVSIARGPNADLCHPATLTVKVTVPTGTSSRPKIYLDGLLKSLQLTGSTATYTGAWDTCAWSDGRKAVLALPNASLTANGKEFTVTATVSGIDKATILSPNAPAALADPRPSIAAPDALVAPELTVHGASTFRVPASRRLTLHVFASSAGSVRAEVDGRRVRTFAVEAGSNLLRLTLPRWAAPAAKPKRAKAGKKAAQAAARKATLLLTSISPAGSEGPSFSRTLVLAGR